MIIVAYIIQYYYYRYVPYPDVSNYNITSSSTCGQVPHPFTLPHIRCNCQRKKKLYFKISATWRQFAWRKNVSDLKDTRKYIIITLIRLVVIRSTIHMILWWWNDVLLCCRNGPMLLINCHVVCAVWILFPGEIRSDLRSVGIIKFGFSSSKRFIFTLDE